MKKTFSFAYKSKVSFGVIMLIILSFALVISLTIAFYYNSEFGSGLIGMSGKVQIEAVGKGDTYDSIEDTYTSNLIITLSDGYDVLIPGMYINVDANCKVYMSTTKPLLRAKLEFILTDDITGSETDGSDFNGAEIGSSNFLVTDICGKLIDIVENNDWYLHTDGYYYYLGDVDQKGATYGNQIMKEIDVTGGDEVIDFINTPFQFPTEIDSSYSGFGIVFKITFQAIQNFIPDASGYQLSNTIDNSQKIFNTFYSSYNDVTGLDFFTITQNNGEYVINPANGVTLPETIVLPTKDVNGNTITKIGDGFNNNTSIKSIVVPSTYTSIEPSAFANSSILTADLSKSSITTIPISCFENSELESIRLPENLEVLDSYSFRGTNISSIVFPETLKTIKTNALVQTNIISLYIPKSVITIESNPIQSNYLYRIVVDDENANYKDVDDMMLLNKTGTQLITGATIIDSESFVIPNTVQRILTNSLYGCHASTIFIPQSVTTIDDGAFNNCSILNIVEFESTTPPTISGDIFNGIITDFKIYVPDSSVSAYKSATNLTMYASRIFALSEKP